MIYYYNLPSLLVIGHITWHFITQYGVCVMIALFWSVYCFFFPLQGGWSALHIAAQNGKKDVVQVLLIKGAKVDFQSSQPDLVNCMLSIWCTVFIFTYMCTCIQDLELVINAVWVKSTFSNTPEQYSEQYCNYMYMHHYPSINWHVHVLDIECMYMYLHTLYMSIIHCHHNYTVSPQT